MPHIEVREPVMCPFSGMQESCTHPDAKDHYGCSAAMCPPPAWCPLHDGDVVISIHPLSRQSKSAVDQYSDRSE